MKHCALISAILLAGCGSGSGLSPDALPNRPDADPNTPDADVTAPDAPPQGACGDIVTFESGRTPTTEIHVAQQGSDQNGDGSAAYPYATIERAAQNAQPGAAIRVHQGTYAGGAFISGLGGTQNAPIWLGGAQGEPRPVIVGGANAIHFVQVAYLIVHDLEIDSSQFNGINCDDGGDFANEQATHHVVFRNLHIHDVGTTGNQDCLKLSGINDYFVLDNVIERCGDGGSGIDQVGGHRGLIARNRFVDQGGNSVQTKGGSEDVEIRGNTFVNGGARALNMGGSTDLALFRPPLTGSGDTEARNIRAIANIIDGGETAIGYVGCVDCTALHNTIVNPGRWVVRILQETPTAQGFLPARNGVFANNLVVYSSTTAGRAVSSGSDTEPGTFTFSHNLWYAADDPGQSTPNLPVAESGGVVGADPLLTGYRTGANSPAQGAGTTLPGVRGDFDGVCYADPPAIGAFAVP